jgi:hypothetical protein
MNDAQKSKSLPLRETGERERRLVLRWNEREPRVKNKSREANRTNGERLRFAPARSGVMTSSSCSRTRNERNSRFEKTASLFLIGKRVCLLDLIHFFFSSQYAPNAHI